MFGKAATEDELKLTNVVVNKDNSVSFGLVREMYCRGETSYVYLFESAGNPTMPFDVVSKGYEAWVGFIVFWLEKDKAVRDEKERQRKLKEEEDRQGIQIDSNGTKFVWRWVPTFVDKHNMRRLIGPAQGRYTKQTKEEVVAYIEAMLNPETNNPKMLKDLFGDVTKIEPRQCKCYPGHFDPIGIYFDG